MLQDFTVDASVRELGMGDYGVWEVTAERPLLEDREVPVAQPAPEVWSAQALPAYRRVLAELGYPDGIPTGERTQNGVAERGFPSYGAIVDLAGALTLEFGGGVGLHALSDADQGAELLLTRAPEGWRMRPAFSSRSRPIPVGDIVYGLRAGDAVEPLAWLGKRDSDAAERQIQPESRAALIVLQDGIGLPAGHRQRQDQRLAELLAAHLPDASLAPVPRRS